MRTPEDRERVVEIAREMFWRRGYDQTAIGDLVEATGYNRYQLYGTFGGKLELFLEALDSYYMQRRNIFMAAACDESAPTTDAFRRTWTFAIDQLVAGGNGCMMGNVAAEVAKSEPAVTERLLQYISEIEGAHAMALRRAEADGELAKGVTPESAARMMMTLILGSGDRAKHGATRDVLLDIFETAMTMIMPGFVRERDLLEKGSQP